MHAFSRFPEVARKDDFRTANFTRYHSQRSVQGTAHCAYFVRVGVSRNICRIQTHNLHYWTSPSSFLFVCLSQNYHFLCSFFLLLNHTQQRFSCLDSRIVLAHKPKKKGSGGCYDAGFVLRFPFLVCFAVATLAEHSHDTLSGWPVA